MKIWNLKIKNYYSFKPNPEANNKYELINLKEENPKIIEQFLLDIEDLEKEQSRTILSLRGDSKPKYGDHERFFSQELDKIFMIGSKSRSNYRENTDDDFDFYKGKNKTELLEELKELVCVCNHEIKGKSELHNISGRIENSFIDSLNGKDIEELENWRLFFISFLHNNGKGDKYKRFKDYSPFVSLTYGKSKHVISRKFALNRTSHKNGFIFIFSINKEKRNYFKTEKMTNDLTELGVRWYDDIHSEIMVINGLFPHFILGILEVKTRSTPKLVINPWLYKEYENNKRFNECLGIPINQEYFSDWMRMEEYRRFWYVDSHGDYYIEEITQKGTPKKVNVFR